MARVQMLWHEAACGRVAAPIRDIADERLERELMRLLQRIKEAQDREVRLALWGDYKRLHARRSRQMVEWMEQRAGLSNA